MIIKTKTSRPTCHINKRWGASGLNLKWKNLLSSHRLHLTTETTCGFLVSNT